MPAVSPSKEATKKAARPRPNLADADAQSKGKGKLVRALGSPDYHTREKAVNAITRFLARKSGLSEKSMLKIWKGIFYAFWHSDKAPIQVIHQFSRLFHAASWSAAWGARVLTSCPCRRSLLKGWLQ